MKPKYEMPKWEFVRRKIKPLFEEAGIFSCELRFTPVQCKALGCKIDSSIECDGCTGSFNLTFAHSMKRLSIETSRRKEYMEEVIKACQHCHKVIEDLGEEKMTPQVRNVIAQRITPVPSIFRK